MISVLTLKTTHNRASLDLVFHIYIISEIESQYLNNIFYLFILWYFERNNEKKSAHEARQ